MVKDALRGYLAAASGVTEVTAARARSAARVLVEQGEATAGQVTALAEDLAATSRRNREGLVLIIRNEIESTLRRLGLGAAGDIDALTQRVRRLEQVVRDLGREPGAGRRNGSSPSTSTAKQSTAKRTAAKKSAAKKAQVKKATAKGTAGKKTVAKKSSSAARRSSSRSTGRRS